MWYARPWSMEGFLKLRFCKKSVENSFFAQSYFRSKIFEKKQKKWAKYGMELKMHIKSAIW